MMHGGRSETLDICGTRLMLFMEFGKNSIVLAQYADLYFTRDFDR